MLPQVRFRRLRLPRPTLETRATSRLRRHLLPPLQTREPDRRYLPLPNPRLVLAPKRASAFPAFAPSPRGRDGRLLRSLVKPTSLIEHRTLQYWLERYRTSGLAALARKPRIDRGRRRKAFGSVFHRIIAACDSALLTGRHQTELMLRPTTNGDRECVDRSQRRCVRLHFDGTDRVNSEGRRKSGFVA
jgi:hypothetical protein